MLRSPVLISQDPSRFLLAGVAALLLVLASCGPAGPANDEATPIEGSAEEEGSPEASPGGGEPWLGDVQVGRGVDPEGAIPAGRESEEFAIGESVYVSMAVSGGPIPVDAAVHVVFESLAGETMAEDEKKVPAEARYLYFDSGDTTGWSPGAYRVVVAVDGEVVSEREIVLGASSRTREGEPG